MSAEWGNQSRHGTEADGGDWSGRGHGPDRLTVSAHLQSAHGFLVDTTTGREVGVVEDVIADPETGAVIELDVQGGWFGRRRTVIAAADVVDVFPDRRRLTVIPSAVSDERG